MADEQTPEQAAEGEPKKKSKLLLIIIIVVVLLLAGGGAAAYFFLMGDDSAEGDEAAAEQAAPVVVERVPPIYTKVRTMEGRPMFVTTLRSDDDKTHYIQIYAEAKSRDQTVADALKLHMPLIVARLNMLFTQQEFDRLRTQEGKIALQQAALDLVREIMMDKIGRPGVEALLFTNLVMQ